MQKLTDRQRTVLDYIRTSIRDNGYPPTLREIGNFMGIRSTNGVNDHLRALEKKGYLTRTDMKSRTLRITDAAVSTLPAGTPMPAGPANDTSPDLVEIPILGRVAAGLPMEALEHREDTVRIDRMLVGGQGRDIFGLRIRGDSMIDAGIHDGDFVFVRKQLEAKKGDIVIALIGDEATCKYYFPEKDHVRLEPANAKMAPILVHAREWKSTQILGVVVGVYRKLA